MKKTYTFAVLAALTIGANAASYTLLTEKDALANTILGTDITSGNGWAINGGATISDLGSGVINLSTTGTSQSTLQGENATASGATDSWSTAVSSSGGSAFTVEVSMKVNDLANGFKFFLGNGTNRTFLDIYNDKIVTTNSDTGLKEVAMTLNDGEFHTFRVATDSANSNPLVHVWVDGVRVSEDNGGVFNSGGDDTRFIFGDTTSGTFGNDIDVDIASISYEAGGFAPVAVPEPSSTALLGLGGLALILRRRK